MKANEIDLERILSKFNNEDWGIAWEAIHNATQRGIEFRRENAIIAYCRTYIWATHYNEDIYTQRKLSTDEHGNRRVNITHIQKFISLEEMADKANKSGETDIASAAIRDVLYQDYNTPEDAAIDREEELALREMLEDIGFSESVIEDMLNGGKIVERKHSTTRRAFNLKDMPTAEDKKRLRMLTEIMGLSMA